MLIRVIDFESTGLPPDCAIVEIGWCDVSFVDCNNVTVGAPQSRFCNPGRPIPPEARAIHHISDEDVRDAVSPDVALSDLNSAEDLLTQDRIPDVSRLTQPQKSDASILLWSGTGSRLGDATASRRA